MDSFDLVSSLQALPETDPIEFDGIQFGPTCAVGQACIGVLTLNLAALNTIPVLSACIG